MSGLKSKRLAGSKDTVDQCGTVALVKEGFHYDASIISVFVGKYQTHDTYHHLKQILS